MTCLAAAVMKNEIGAAVFELRPRKAGALTSWRMVYYPPHGRLTAHRHDVAQFSVLLAGDARETTDHGAFDSRPFLMEYKPAEFSHSNEFGPNGARIAGRLEQYLTTVQDEAPESPASYAAVDLIGNYIDPRLGKISVMRDDDGLKVVFGVITGALEHLGGDSYLADIGQWNDMPPQVFVFREDEKLGFVLDWGGRIFIKQ